MSVEDCCLRLFPGESHSLLLGYIFPVSPWLAWSLLETQNLPAPVQCLLLHYITLELFRVAYKYQTAKPLLYTVYRRNRKQLVRKWSGEKVSFEAVPKNAVVCADGSSVSIDRTSIYSLLLLIESVLCALLSRSRLSSSFVNLYSQETPNALKLLRKKSIKITLFSITDVCWSLLGKGEDISSQPSLNPAKKKVIVLVIGLWGLRFS